MKSRVELAPQKPSTGRTLASTNIGLNSSSNVMSVASLTVLVLVILKVKVTLLPAATGSLMNDLVKPGTAATTSASSAGS